MKLTEKNLQYILLLLIVIILVVAYRFGYVEFAEKAEAVSKENTTLEARLASLEEKLAMQEEYQNGLVELTAEENLLLDSYGAGNTPEKSIMFINKLEKSVDIDVASVTFSEDMPVFASSTLDEMGLPKIMGYKTEIAISYKTSYAGLKRTMDFINNYDERMNVASFSSVYDQETGGVSGAMVINLFSVKDENHVYEDPSVVGVPIGTPNIFN